MLSKDVCLSCLLRFCDVLFTSKKKTKQNKTKPANQSRQRLAMIKTKSSKNISLTVSKAEIKLALDGLRNHRGLLYSPKEALTFRR